MKKSILCLLFFGMVYAQDTPSLSEKGERRIVIVSCSYNNERWYDKSLSSIFAQNYENFHLIYVDDCSTDNTYARVKEYVASHGMEDKVTLIRNEQRKGAMSNQYDAIHSCKPTDLIVIVDGDDFLAHRNVLSFLNTVYSNPNIWLTYGQFAEYMGGEWNVDCGPQGYRACAWCTPMPSHVVKNNGFRSHPHIPSHLRTFYAGLFQNIKKEDLMIGNEFVKMSPDLTAMFPMIEMARDHFKFIGDILLMYNGANSLNEHKISKQLQRSVDLTIRARPRYDKIETPFIVHH